MIIGVSLNRTLIVFYGNTIFFSPKYIGIDLLIWMKHIVDTHILKSLDYKDNVSKYSGWLWNSFQILDSKISKRLIKNSRSMNEYRSKSIFFEFENIDYNIRLSIFDGLKII